jgi:hypothetical protein
MGNACSQMWPQCVPRPIFVHEFSHGRFVFRKSNTVNFLLRKAATAGLCSGILTRLIFFRKTETAGLCLGIRTRLIFVQECGNGIFVFRNSNTANFLFSNEARADLCSGIRTRLIFCSVMLQRQICVQEFEHGSFFVQ